MSGKKVIETRLNMPRKLHHCPAPAKLNLFLHVTGQRADGYHLLETVFQLIDLGDTLHFTVREDGQIRRVTKIPNVPEKDDLTIRAAMLLQKEIYLRTGKKPGADIAIEKRLPMGGGLGGGSSDAATTLMALNHLWNSHLSKQELMNIGIQLGADIPFFIFGQTAFAEGIGEILSPIDIAERWFVIIDPGISVSTSTIFTSKELTRNTEKIKIANLPSYLTKNSLLGKNDLQSVAEKLYPAISEAIDWLNGYANAKMTGSGACVFASFDNEADADYVVEHIPKKWNGWKAKGLKFHPLDKILEISNGNN